MNNLAPKLSKFYNFNFLKIRFEIKDFKDFSYKKALDIRNLIADHMEWWQYLNVHRTFKNTLGKPVLHFL